MKKRVVYILFAVVAVINVSIFFYAREQKTKIYYVDLQKLYSEFQLKKELETTLANYSNSSTLQMDSLAMNINQLKYQIEEHPVERDVMLFDQLNQVYIAKEESFRLERDKMSKQFDDQIWKQLNQYIKEYAVENNCDLVVGGNGDGSIMYAEPGRDITESMIKYVNEKYNGEL